MTNPSATVTVSDEEFFTTEQACKALGLSRFSLYHYVSAGRLPAFKRGKYRFFKRTDVEALLIPQPIEPKTRKRKNTPVRKAKGR